MHSATCSERNRLIHALVRSLGALVVGAVPFAALQAHAQTVVTQSVRSETGHDQTRVPVTFGQVFRDGDVPKDHTVIATLNGRPIPLQVDAKATNPDGSLRHAVLTVIVPSLPGKADLPLSLSSAPAAATHSRAPLTLMQLLATHYDASVSLNAKGATYSVDARKLLQAALDGHQCKPWGRQCNVWLSGPLASAWVVNGPVSTGIDTPLSRLRIYFAVRAYAGSSPGTIGQVRTDIIIENSNAFAPQAQPQYTATLTSGSASYTSPALTQYAYTRWHHVLWWNDDQPDVYLRQDTQYIQASKAVSRYMKLTPDAKFLAHVRQSCPPLDHCDQTRHMGQTGAQAAIGPLPRWTSVYIIDPDVRAYRWMLADTDALGAYGIHYRDAGTGWPVSIHKHPHATIINWVAAHKAAQAHNAEGAEYKADLIPSCVNNSVVKSCDHSWYVTGNPNKWDNAHQPAESYVPYMVTGDYYYMSELAFGASHNEIWPNETYRGLSKGLIGSSYSQVRGKAWVLREMVDAAWLLPDGYPLKAEFMEDVEHSLEYWNSRYTHNRSANSLGLMRSGTRPYSLHEGKQNAVAPWQHNFLTWSAGHAAELGFDGAAQFRDWLAKFEIGLMTDWLNNPTHGYCWLEASAYKIQVKGTAGNWFPSYTAVYAATFPSLVGFTCNSPAMVAAMSKLTHKPWKAGEMSGFPSSASGYPAHFQIGVATAADTGLSNAAKAWEIFQSRSVKPQPPHAYNDYPNFAILPRRFPH